MDKDLERLVDDLSSLLEEELVGLSPVQEKHISRIQHYLGVGDDCKVFTGVSTIGFTLPPESWALKNLDKKKTLLKVVQVDLPNFNTFLYVYNFSKDRFLKELLST